jgi:hypothetical protein
MRWLGHVASMGRRIMDVGFWWESQKERGPLGKCRSRWRIMLKWIFER